MYKVLYIGFLTFQLISVFCNLKSSKKDILEAHNSRKCVMMEHCQLLLAYLAGFLLKVKNTVECILDLIQKRKNSLGIW